MKTKPNPFHQTAMVRDPESGELKEKLDAQSAPNVTAVADRGKEVEKEKEN